MKYIVGIDNGMDYCGNGGSYSTLDQAKAEALSVLETFMESTISDWDSTGWFSSVTDAWNSMIHCASVCVDEYDPDTGMSETVWEPSDEELAAIGWIEREEE